MCLDLRVGDEVFGVCDVGQEGSCHVAAQRSLRATSAWAPVSMR
jgi:hypothetical protein